MGDTHSAQDQSHNKYLSRYYIRESNTTTTPCLTARPSSRTRTCPRRCSRTPWIVPLRHLRNTTLRKISLPTLRRSLTKSTTQPGIALWAGILVPTSPMRPGISSTFTWARWQFCSSRVDKPSKTSPHHILSLISVTVSIFMVVKANNWSSYEASPSWCDHHQSIQISFKFKHLNQPSDGVRLTSTCTEHFSNSLKSWLFWQHIYVPIFHSCTE